MPAQLNSWTSFRERSRGLSVAAASVAFLVGAVVIVGWEIGRPPQPGFLTGIALSKANSGVGLMLCGIALALRSLAAEWSAGRSLARAFAAVALAIGALTLAEHMFGVDLHIDLLLFARTAVSAGASNAGRMSFGSALCLTLAATALVAVPRRAADWCAISVAIISLMAFTGYAYSLVTYHRLISYGSFPLLGAVTFMVLAAGTMCVEPERGLVRDVFDGGPSGTVLRRLLPAAAGIPIVLAWLAQEGKRRGVYDDPIGLGAMAAATIVALVAMIWVTARSLDESEALRKAAVEERIESEAEFQELFDSAPVGLSHSRADGSLIAVNQAFVTMLGYPDAASLRAVNAAALYPSPADRDAIMAEVNAGGHIVREFQLRRADGTILWVQLHMRPINRDGGPLRYESALIDLSERKRLEQQFVQAQKMEAVGRLAGGVAHDFNNMLTVIRSYCDLVVLETPESSPIRSDLREISRAADQAATLSRQLLAFSRKQVMQPQVFNPNAVVEEVHSMLRRVLPSAVKCELMLADDLDTIRADPGSVNQVMMNLGINASDAMPNGGTLSIATSNCEIGAAYAASHPGAARGRYVCIEVRDTGAGMDAETLSHIYEPFFTTKPVGKGTGLGLATVYGIVEQNHGWVTVESAVGRGTTFKVYFPLARGAPDSATARVSGATARLAPASKVVLVVEDDDAVRSSIARILGREGFTVLSARDGSEGVKAGAAHSGPIDLLISDVMMPVMGGRQVAERMVTMHPESRVLLISGYTDDEVLRKGEIDPSFAFLAKPFSVEQLVRKVDGVLAG